MDISDLVAPATSSPQEAATNIRNATIVGTDPTSDPSINRSMKPIVDQTLAPTEATPAVQDYMSQSTEHTSLVIGDKSKPQESDIHSLNFMDSTAKFIGDLVYDRPTEDQELTTLAMRKSKNGGQLGDDDKYRLWELNQNREAAAKQSYNEPPENPLLKTAETVGTGALDAVRGLRHNAKLIAGFAGAGALIEGAATGGAGLLSGGVLGLRAGVAASFATDAYNTGYGGTYNELDRMQKPDGTPLNMDETTKSNLSQGVGLASAVIMGAAGAVTAKGTPWLNSIMSPRVVALALQDPANAVLRSSLSQIGHAVTAMGAGAAFTEVAKIYAEEAAHTYDGTQASFINALKSTADKLSSSIPNDAQARVNQAGFTGMGTGLVFGGGLALLNRAGGNVRAPLAPPEESSLALPAGPSEPSAPSGGTGPVIDAESTRLTDNEFNEQVKAVQVKKSIDKLTGQKEFLENFLKKPNLTDQQKTNLNKELNQVNGQLGVHDNLSQIPPEAHEAVDESVKVLKFQDSMEEVAKVAGQTKMQKLAPQEVTSVLTKVMERSGIKKLYVDEDFFRSLTQPGDGKEEAANNALDPSGLTAKKMNQPVEVSAVDVMTQAIKDPSILGHVSLKPGSRTAVQGKDYLEGLMSGDETRKKIFNQLGVKAQDVQPVALPSNVVSIGSKQKDEEPFDLEGHARRTQEILDRIKSINETVDFHKKLMENPFTPIPPEYRDMSNPEGNPTKQKENSKEILKEAPIRLKEAEAELADIKSKVTSHFQTGAHGDLLVGKWDNPGAEDSARAASDFVDHPTYTEALEKVLPKPEVQKFNIAHQNARKDIADNIKETAVNEMNKVQDQNVEEQKDIRRQEEIARIAYDPNYAIIDKFRRTQIADTKGKKKTSFYAIDPETLPSNLLKFTDEPRIKELGIFKKGGQNLDDVAQLLGVNSGEQLLKIFANTPTREQVAMARAKANAVADERAIREQDDLNHTRIIEALNADMANQREVMKYMREKEWSATKGVIKRIALYPPSVEEWNQRAKDIVMQTRVGSLNPTIFRIGERKSHRIAVKEILKMNPEAAFMALEQRGINLAALKESYLMTAKINRGFRFARKFNDKGTMQLLKSAGPTTYNAAVEILNSFKLTRTSRSLPVGQEQGPNGDFLKWATREAKAGRGDFSIPERLTDLRQSANDMTVEQFLVIIDRLRAILNEAKLHGQLMKLDQDEKDRDEAWDMDRFAEKVQEEAIAHPGSSNIKLAPGQGNRTGMARAHYWFAEREALVVPKQSIYRELDRGHTGGFFYRSFDEEMEGAGKFYEKSGFTYQKKWNKWIDDNMRKLFKDHGDVEKLEGKMLFIPEFKDIFELNNGHLTKADLLTAMANRGQQYTKDLLRKNNGGVSDELWQTVFDRELETKDVKYMQGIVDLYKDPKLRAKTLELQKLEGRDVTFIEGVPYTHTKNGVTTTYPGGYIRARYLHNYAAADVKKGKSIEEQKSAAFYDKDARAAYEQYASETTDQGYLISRTDSKDRLKLGFHTLVDGLREIVHDHSYRVPMRNFWARMDHPDVIPAMIKIVGEPKVKTLININLELANRPKQKDDGYFADTNRMIKAALNAFGSNFASAVIWGNMSAVIKQLESMPEMYQAMGPKFFQHVMHVNIVYFRNPDKFWGFVGSARNFDPNLDKYFVDGVEDDLDQVMEKWIPKKTSKAKGVASATIKGATIGAVAGGPIGAAIGGVAAGVTSSLTNKIYEALMTAGFMPHQLIDAYLKALQAHAVLKYVLAGDHPLYPQERLDKMSDDEKFDTIRSIIQQMSSLTQIQNRPEFKAPIQKNIFLKPLVYFWNYPRTVLNNNILDARRTAWKAKEAFKNLGEGGGGGGSGGDDGGSGGGGGSGGDSWNPAGAAKAAGAGANIALTRMILNFIGAMILYYGSKRTLEGFDFLKRKIDWHKPEDWAKAGVDVIENLMMENAKMMLEIAPGGKNIAYALESKKKYSMVDVKDPITQAASSMVTALEALVEMVTVGHTPNRMQLRAMLESESYFLNAFPVRGYLAAVKWMEQNTKAAVPAGFKVQLNDKIVENTNRELKDFVKDPGKADKTFVAQVDAFQKQLAPVAASVPKEASDAIKMAESGGKWNSPNGMYGFSSSDWKEIMHSAPDLGLTENGRTAKDTAQQEKAMEWSLRENAGRLAEKDIPVNTNTLYEAHKLGVDTYLKLFAAPADQKVKAVLGDALDSHPDLANFKTIGQVKKFLSSKIENGAKAVEKGNNLTSKTSQNED